jgi:hypothetical protein
VSYKIPNMLQIELSKKTGNPFYGMKACLELYQNASKGVISVPALNACYNEVRNSKEGREMLFSILFSIGDITARQHNLFKKQKTDSGGNAQREAFVTILNWLKGINYPQFRKFLFANLFNEYVSFDVLLMNRVKTTKGKKKVEKVLSNLSGSEEYLNDLSDFVAGVIKGTNPSHKHFLAKFLTRPRLSKRKGHKVMLPETREIMKAKENFLIMVSEKAGLEVVKKPTYFEFPGYFGWRKEYIGDLESVLFASGKIKEFDRAEFHAWLDKLPSGARFRVRCRLLDKSNNPKKVEVRKGEEATAPIKWPNLGEWFLEWEKFKDQKQTEQRVIEEKVRQGTATETDVTNLAKVKKEAKVTVGAVNFATLLTEILTGKADKAKIQPFLDKVKLDYNNLVFVDDSGSMRSTGVPGIMAFDFAIFMATICLMKNPDDVGRALLGFYSNSARVYNTMTSRSELAHTILRSTPRKVNEPLYDPNEHFLDNFKRIREFAHSIMTSNGTNISSIPDYLNRQLETNPSLLEALQAFPVWTIISDGNWNNLASPEASINDFMRRCQQYFGFKPFIIAIDVSAYSAANVTRFSGIENFMFIPPNPAQIEQLLTNFKDMDIMDVYTPLQSLHRSNRYEPVRNYTT